MSVFLVIAVSLFGQTPSKNLLPIVINDKYGYINQNGDIVIEPQYDWAGLFYESLAVIKMVDEDNPAGKFGYIDSTGRIVVSPMFDAAGNYCQGWARVKQGRGSFIYVDKTGRAPIPSQFFECYNVMSFPIPVRVERSSKAGFVDKKGEYVIEAKFDVARPFVDGYAVVGLNNKQGYINLKGDFIIEPQFYRANYFQSGLARVILKDAETKKKTEGYINKDGKFVVEPTIKMGNARDFSEGLAAVSMDGQKWGFIDTNGKIAINPEFEKASPFSEGYAKVRIDGKYGFIDKNGDVVIKPKFDNVSDFRNGIASIFLKNKRMGYINKEGDYIWKAGKPEKKEDENYQDKF